MLTVPAEEVKTMRRTVPASLQARMMLIIPSTVGLITSFCNGNHVVRANAVTLTRAEIDRTRMHTNI
jgi:ribosomal protein S19